MYAITRLVIGCDDLIEISNEEYNEIKKAREIIGSLFLVESNFHAICEAFKSIEIKYFSESLESLLYSRDTDQDFFLIGATYAPMFLASLATVRLYVDTIASHVRFISSGDIPKSTVESIFSAKYDSSFEYRVMEAIRNYAQHRSFPVHGIRLGGRWEDEQMMFSVEYFFSSSEISKSDNFKSAVLREIEDKGGRINLRNCFKEYFFLLCRAHSEIRHLIADHVDNSNRIIAEARLRWIRFSGENNVVGVAACSLEDGLLEKSIDPIYLKTSGDRSTDYMRRKMFSFANMHKRRVAL